MNAGTDTPRARRTTVVERFQQAGRNGHHRKPDAPPAARFELLDSAEFATGNYQPEWLVEGVLVRGQPAVVAGPSKCMKTSALVDLAVSLATGTPFLGRFDVPRPERVALVSGES